MDIVLRTYRGNCRCEDFIFQVTHAALDPSACECTLCSKKAAIWVITSDDKVNFVRGEPDRLSSYLHGHNKHLFCPRCGTTIMFTQDDDASPVVGVNVRALQDTNIWNLQLQKPDEYAGPEPSFAIEGGKVYKGSCHCGAVTLAVKSKRLEGDPDGVLECNCSGCVRTGAIWMYPQLEQIQMLGQENLQVYTAAGRQDKKSFCRICGVHVCTRPQQLDEEAFQKLPQDKKDWYERVKNIQNINVRVLDDLDLDKVKVSQFDGYSILQPQYKNP